MLQITLFFTCVRISFGRSTTRLLNVKFIHVLLFRKSTKRCDTSYLSCLLLEPKCSCITFRELTNDTVLFTITILFTIYQKSIKRKSNIHLLNILLNPLYRLLRDWLLGKKTLIHSLDQTVLTYFRKEYYIKKNISLI